MKTENTLFLLSQIESALAELDLRGGNETITKAMSIVRVAGDFLKKGR